MRAKIGLLIITFTIGITSVFAFDDPKLRWEFKLPKKDVNLQRIWQTDDLAVCYVDNLKSSISKTYSLYCIDVATGKQLWDPMTFKSGYRIMPSTLVFIGKNMYFLSVSGKIIEFVCYDLRKNCQIWKTYFRSPKYTAEGGVLFGGCTDKYYWYYHNDSVNIYNVSDGKLVFIAKSKCINRAVTGDLIFLENDIGRRVSCFDLISKKDLWVVEQKKGTVRYEYECEGKTYIMTKDANNYVQSNVRCLETTTGKEFWNNEYDGEVKVFWASCTKVTVHLYVKNKPDKLLLLNPEDGKQIWELKLDSSDFTLECNDKYVLARFYYTCKPFQIHIYDMENTKKLFSTASNFLSPPITYENKVFYIDGIGINTGIRYLRRVDPDSGKTVWSIAGKIYDFCQTGKTVLVAEPTRISCWGDPNP